MAFTLIPQAWRLLLQVMPNVGPLNAEVHRKLDGDKGTGSKLRASGGCQVILVNFPTGCDRERFRWVADLYVA